MARKPSKSYKQLLAANGLRPTRQRLALAKLLFEGGGRHVEAQKLHAEAAQAGFEISLATVYNALREFDRAGLIHRIAIPSERVWFDTDTGSHRHYYIEDEDRVLDVPEAIDIAAPKGYRIARIDTIVHLIGAEDDETVLE
ncbi:Iron-responsive regulator Irr [Candidatus Rhodobacter oscarellae]|uniref:Iron-responsive regulator Irr n=1 Tax=Candidatus Rhodobacter oscarellae TaxID=1675527 RepID=A0A0J9EBG5_9RHOB|nr:Fur family transcriptional regulator [Candidatus Rhodobacter lobularis]KMW59991.1 Iron-responsive regulator Irr [Candidatus Rhodobacter lobularis]